MPTTIRGSPRSQPKPCTSPSLGTWEVKTLAGGIPSITGRDSAPSQAMAAAMQTVWCTRPVFARGGGTIGAVGELQRIGLDSLLVGFSLPDDNMHGPNEKQHLPTLYHGVEAFIRFLANMGETS